MTGEPAIRGIVVTHARLGEALIEAAEEISGVTEALVAVSNRGTTPRVLQDRVAEAVGAGPAVVFGAVLSAVMGAPGRGALGGRPRIAAVILRALTSPAGTGSSVGILILDARRCRSPRPASAASLLPAGDRVGDGRRPPEICQRGSERDGAFGRRQE